MTEKADRTFEIISNSHTRAHQEYSKLKEAKHLSIAQQSIIRWLIQDLVCAEGFAQDPLLAEGPNPYLLRSVADIGVAIEKEVPREVIGAILDRDFLKITASGAVGYNGG